MNAREALELYDLLVPKLGVKASQMLVVALCERTAETGTSEQQQPVSKSATARAIRR